MLNLLFNFFTVDQSNYQFNNIGTIIEKASHCWFARERAFSYGNKVWICQQHNDGAGYSQHIVEINTDTESITSTRVGTEIEYDDHNEPSILIRQSDQRLFITYTEHNDPLQPVRTRISTNPLDSSSWQPEKTYDLGENSRTNYCSCFQVTNGDIYIFSRQQTSPISWFYLKSTDGGETFSSYTKFFSGSTSAYMNISQSDTNSNIIHFIGSGHPIDSAVSKVGHFYFDSITETFYDSSGNSLTLPVDNTTSTLILNPSLPDTAWIEDIIVHQGKPRALMTFIPNAKNNTYQVKELYYSEWNGSAWTTPYKIHQSLDGYVETGGAPITQGAYPPLAAFARFNPDIIIASKETESKTEIFRVERNNYNSFTTNQLTSGNTYDQWRPITVNSNKYNVFWLNKISYPDYQNSYNQELKAGTLT